MKKQKGITLIGLIITVIILLILTAITIDIVIDGNLFDQAEDAVDTTNDKTMQEQNDINTIIGWLDGEAQSTGHTYEWATTKEATCTEAGERTGTCTDCGKKVTQPIPLLGHNFQNGACTRCEELEPVTNYAPIITSVTLNAKTTDSFTIDALATDSDEENLTYSLYIVGENEAKDTAEAAQGETVQLTAESLSMYTDYTYYVTVTDNIAEDESEQGTVKTKCSGTTIQCTTGKTTTCTTCKGSTTVSCTWCGGDGRGPCLYADGKSWSKYTVTRTETHSCDVEAYGGNTQNPYYEACDGWAEYTYYKCQGCGRELYEFYCDGSVCGGDYWYHTEHSSYEMTCPKCNGNKKVNCSTCKGSGSLYTYCEHSLANPHSHCDHNIDGVEHE